MTRSQRTLTFRVTVASTAAPEALYDVISDLRTHLVWGGEQAPSKGFRLLSMDAPAGPAHVGDRFSSTGANGRMTFHDRSTVVEAERPGRFGFDTESRLERGHVRAFESSVSTRYEIEPSAGGSTITHTSEVRPGNYVPYWLRPGMRRMARAMVQPKMRRHVRNLAAMAETTGPRERETTTAT